MRQTAGVNRRQTATTEPQWPSAPRKTPRQKHSAGRTLRKTAATEMRCQTQTDANRDNRTQSQAQTDATRLAGTAMPDALIPAPQFRIPNSALPPAVPSRAQTPVPELKPASTNAAPADNSLAYKNHRRSAASAREMTSRGNARENRIKRAAGAKIGGFLP